MAKAIELEVTLAGPYPLRLTALHGLGSLRSGEKVLVTADLAAKLIADFPAYLRATGPAVDADLPAAGWARPGVAAPAKEAVSPVATQAAPPTAKKGTAGNKSMAGKPAAEAKA